ncbi:conjugal transfer protein TraG [Desulfopila sp. IMCC35006]|uniref:conjugal transfer protein TraG N-terminal domain-containing protein n=1 Tax=Desulfopila sp. IMCC35006 TaxID=2569542 RepID=UPI0010ACAD08|nr:conjugal transfer protein TraG N-terminal domain-containing protein [Desulfopila sp. IMCC35006]TKB23102.1 conjugal transfer protein TraG [Desulfopila sp. IMCC35006]
MKETTIKFPAILCLVFLVATIFYVTPAFAMDMEYYTYGGFNPITQAFTRLALIFSDAGYIGLFAVVTVLGFLAGAISWLVQVSNGGKATPLIWTVPVFFGIILYFGLFVPKGNITVYDPTLNRFQTIGGIPDAVVFTAGALNKIERGLVDIIDTASAPDSEYSRGAGGIGFKTLESVRNSYIKDNHLRTSLIRYTKDCVTFELMRPGTTLSLDTLRNDTTDFLIELGKAVSPAIYTVYYDSTEPAGVTKTCTEAWNLLLPIFQNPNNYAEALRKTCGKASFDSNNALEYNTCKDLITSTLRFTTGNTVIPEKLIQQRQISEILYTFYYQEDVETAMLMEANRKITSQGIGVGIAMNEWIPIIKAIMTAIAIGMIPFLALFLPTPVVGKALSAMFGFFCFLTIWGITDAVVHTAAMDYAQYAFEEMRQSSLGVYSMAAFPSLSEKMLSMFGIIRSSGIMLASLFTMMLIKFGGHALAMMAGSLSSAVSVAGGQAGALMTPEGTSSAMSQQIKASGNLEGMPQHRFSNMASAEAFNSVHSPVGNYNSSMNARKALAQSGQIPQGTSDADYAEMKHSFNQQAGTAAGQSSVSLGPDGQATQGKTNAVMPSGSTMAGTTFGAGGAGVQNLNGAWGKGSFDSDGHGGTNLTSASVNGMSPMALAEQNAHINTEKAAHALGTNENWDKMTSQLQTDGHNSGESRAYADKLANVAGSEWGRVINDKSGFVNKLTQAQQKQLQAYGAGGAGVNMGIKAEAAGRYSITATGDEGKTLSFSVDESTANSIKESMSSVRERAVSETFGDSKGLQFATNLANKIGATKAASYMKEASNMTRTTETTGADATTAFVGWYANDRYGSSSPENIDKAGAALNHMATGGAAGMNQLQEHQKRFLNSGNYTWGDGKAQADATIDATRSKVGGGMGNVQGQVMSGANTASGRTHGIGPGDFSGHPANNHESLVTPQEEGKPTLKEADDLRDSRNKDFEEFRMLPKTGSPE